MGSNATGVSEERISLPTSTVRGLVTQFEKYDGYQRANNIATVAIATQVLAIALLASALGLYLGSAISEVDMAARIENMRLPALEQLKASFKMLPDIAKGICGVGAIECLTTICTYLYKCYAKNMVKEARTEIHDTMTPLNNAIRHGSRADR